MLRVLHEEIVACRRCPRLVAFRERVAREKRARYRDQDYWGRPVPGFGDIEGAHRHRRARAWRARSQPHRPGFHRRSLGRFSLRRASSTWTRVASALDRAETMGSRSRTFSSPARCGASLPTTARAPRRSSACAPFFTRELSALGRARVLLALGSIGWKACLDHLARTGEPVPRPRPAFAHGAEVALGRIVVAGQLPREPAEHADRSSHAGDVRRGARARAVVLSAKDPVDT